MKNTFIKLFYKLKDFFPPKASCPTRLSALKTFALIFNTEIITDINGNSFVVLSGEYGDFNYEVNDKTEFEAVNNHIHILDNISKAELGELKDIIRENEGKSGIIYCASRKEVDMLPGGILVIILLNILKEERKNIFGLAYQMRHMIR